MRVRRDGTKFEIILTTILRMISTVPVNCPARFMIMMEAILITSLMVATSKDRVTEART